MITKIIAFSALAILVTGGLLGIKSFAAGTITGRVFQDFNGNGVYDTDGGTVDAPTAIDTGVSGTVVTAYDSAGAAQGTATSIADGTYSLTTTGTGPYRLEFVPPTGYQPSARNSNSIGNSAATGSASTTIFVGDGTIANVNVALNRPEEYCQNNPGLASCQFNLGAQNGTFAANPVLQNFNYDSGTVYTDTVLADYDAPTTHTLSVPSSSLGSIYGLAYNRSTQRIYASAYYKRFVGFGNGVDNTYNGAPATSDDPGAIYVVNPATNAVVSKFTVPGATTNSHSNAAASDTTNSSWDAVGKTSLGGITLSDDNNTLFVMNLENRTLYALNPATGASITSQAVPTPATCAAADVRPFAVKYYRSNLYVGMVCSAQSTQTATNLRAYVYQVSPTTLAFGTTPYTFQLNYNRGFNEPAQGATTFPNEWKPWTGTIVSETGVYTYPQPMLTDIEIDNGNLVLGLRDRLGDQGQDIGGGSGYRPAGDVLRACGSLTNFPANLTLEANGRCGGTGTAPQDTGQGPGATTTTAGSGEFYFNDDFSNPANSVTFHDEVLSGGLLHIPGYAQTITTSFDPISRLVGPNETFDQGFRWLDNTSGASTKAYRLLNGDGNTSAGGEFGKANGLGDVIPLCNSAPIEIGNRVWRDANNNGVQDASESRVGSDTVSLAGITVRLYNSSNVLIATATTDLDGEYYFSSAPGTSTANAIYGVAIAPNSTYQIRFDNAADFATGGVLAGLVPTRADATQQAGIDDYSDSDAVRVTNPVNSPATGTFPVITYTTGAAGTNNHTLDAGFASPVSIGSVVFNDVNNSGTFDTGETGIGGVSVELLYDADGDGAITGGELTAIATTTTSTTAGSVGNYFFGNLTPGNYQVRIPTAPTTFTVSSTITNTTDSRIDNDDNGTQAITGGATISPIINLTPGAEPLNAVETGQGGTLDDATTDANGDMTVDFGFFAPASLGDIVFSDLNRNGRQDAGEPGVANVQVRLYNSAGTEINVGPDGILGTADDAAGGMLTTAAGAYLFQGLPPGTYSVGFTLPTGFGYAFTLQDAAVATDATDSDANPATGRTGNYILNAGQSNLTVDAGVVQTVSLGNQVFNDANNNGIRDAAEVGIAGVTVNLYLDADNDNVPDGVAIATTTTGANGLYLFAGLAPNNYIVGVVTPTNFVSSSVDGGDPDNNTDNDDNGIRVVGNETRSNAVSLVLGTEPTAENPYNEADTPDNSNNLTVDFGFTASYSIGNRVWFDTNNDGFINNAAGNIEVGIDGVSVSLFASTDTTFSSALQTTTTASGGYYRFDNLVAGGYVVRINPSNFANGAILAGYQNTTGAGAANADIDSTAATSGEDGINPTGAANTVQANGIVTNLITLGGTAEPTGETDVIGGTVAGQGTADNQANMTIDFGFYQMSLSGTLWNDNGNGNALLRDNGILNSGEPLLSNVRVQIYSGATTTEILVGPDGILGTADDAAGGMITNASGNYNFQGLPAGTYRVVVTLPNGGTPSTVRVTDPNANVDSDNNGFPDNTGNFAGRIISGVITLTPGGEVSFVNSAGQTLNPTVDFGFVFAGPTAIQLDRFDAYTDGSSVELKWSTGNEVSNLGFNIYREVDGKRELLNAAPIAGSALRSSAQLEVSGNNYSWTDKSYFPNAVYYLEDLDTDGSVNLHGAVTAEFRQTLENQPNARMFSDLTNETASATREVSLSQTLAVPNKKELAAATARQLQIAARGGAKITVNHDGWYRVSVSQLQAAGFNTNADPRLWQLFADGAEVPFKLNADSIEFFGRGADTPLTDKRVYYLISGEQTGLRISAVNGGAAEGAADAQSFSVTVERKDRTVYLSGLRNGEENDNWFGALISRSSQRVQTLNAVNIVPNGRAHLSLKLQGLVETAHLVSVKFNDVDLGTVEFNGFENKQFDFDLPAASVVEGTNRVYLQSNGANNDMSLVDAIRLTYQRGYTAANNQIRFRVPAHQSVRVNGFTDEKISIYDLRSGAAQTQVIGASENSAGNYGFSLGAANVDRELIAVADSGTEPALVETNAPSAWNNASNKADFIVITSGELRESADRLAAMRQAQGLQTKVVLVEDLFDEFSFGSRDPRAVKQFLNTATTRWQTKPQYALLFGDASYDARNNLGLSVTRDIVPTKMVDTETMETSSDAWLADFDEDGIEDIALGRLPVGNASEAAAAVEKLARFENQKERQEKTNVLIADNGFENYSETLQSILPGAVKAVRIDRAGQSDGQAHQQIIERLNDNPLLVTYTGHGSTTAWASTGVFSQNDVAGINNRELSFYLLMNCLNGYTNQPTEESLAETLIKSPNAAVAVWTSSGVTNPDTQAAVSQSFTKYAFNASAGRAVRLGDVIRAAKRATDDSDVRRTWQLIGDPTLVLK